MSSSSDTDVHAVINPTKSAKADARGRAGGSRSGSHSQCAMLDLGEAVDGRVVNRVAGSLKGQHMTDPKDAGHVTNRGGGVTMIDLEVDLVPERGCVTGTHPVAASIATEGELRRQALLMRVRAKQCLAGTKS